MFKGVLFDLDGVITDTSVCHFNAWCDAIKKSYQLTIPNDVEEAIKGVSRKESLEIILETLGLNADQKKFNQILDIKNKIYLSYLDNLSEENIIPGIKELLNFFKRNNIKTAVTSASLNANFILKKLDLIDYFDYIVDPSTCRGKPEPDIFLEGVRGLGLYPNDCIGIEDSISGVMALNKANIFSVAIGESSKFSIASVTYQSVEVIKIEDLIKNIKS